MNEAKFKAVYGESRNGCNHMVKYRMARGFIYSDGVQELAETGVYWMLDIVGTELPAFLRGAHSMGVFKAVSKDGRARLSLSLDDDAPDAWSREIESTDMPEGEWVFYLQYDGEHVAMLLPSEY